MKKLFEVGDSVVYSRNHLRSCGIYTGDLCFDRGTVSEVRPVYGVNTGQVLVIDWDIQGRGRAHSDNVILRSEVHKEPN